MLVIAREPLTSDLVLVTDFRFCSPQAALEWAEPTLSTALHTVGGEIGMSRDFGAAPSASGLAVDTVIASRVEWNVLSGGDSPSWVPSERQKSPKLFVKWSKSGSTVLCTRRLNSTLVGNLAFVCLCT